MSVPRTGRGLRARRATSPPRPPRRAPGWGRRCAPPAGATRCTSGQARGTRPRLRREATRRASSRPAKRLAARRDFNHETCSLKEENMPEELDLIVIGAGSAARDGAMKARTQYDARVAMVERTRWGGSCPNVACKPTKAYLVVADLLHDINHLAGKLGIEVGPARADLARIKARKDTLLKSQEQWAADIRAAGIETFPGEAALVDAHTVRVGGTELRADRILLATGSRTAIPPIEGIEDVEWVDHISALELTELPESLLVVGGGAVGLEFGQAFSRFGSRVTMVDAMEHLGARSDPDAAAELEAVLTEEGIELITNSFVSSVRKDGDEIEAVIRSRDGGSERTLRFSTVLLASGRAPNVEELGLEQIGIGTT